MNNLSWAVADEHIEKLKVKADYYISLTAGDIRLYPKCNDNAEQLSQLLANLNYYVLELGEIQAKCERLKTWTDKRYEIEKGLETVRIVREDKKAVNYAQSAKYEKIQGYLDIMVNAAALYMRVQNARSSARDTTEAIRSRISQIKGAIRSS